MKSKISFNINIFIEEMRQLRITGIICTIIMAAITIIRTASLILDKSSIDSASRQTTYTGIEWMPWLIISFMLITPLLMFKAFQFINKRNSSDFYHSLPHTRGSIYISICAAVMAWIFISVLATVIPSLLTALFFSEYVTFAYDTFLLFVLNNIAACVLVGGAVMIAKSLSGTIFNGIILTGIILFVPRFMIITIISVLESNPIFEGCIGNIFTDNYLNVVTSTVLSIFGDIDISTIFISIPSIIYTLILGIIYFILGGIAFCKRSSESASKSAPNSKLQSVYRILIALIFTSILVALLFYDKCFNIHINVFSYVICYIAIAFIYFLYELLTTKKLKNLIRAIPGLGIVALLNVIIYFGLSGAYSSAMNFRPASDEINSIVILPDVDPDYNYDKNISYYNYVLNEIGGLEISDQEIISDVAKTLDKNLTISEKDTTWFYEPNVYRTSLQINTNGKSKRRNIYLSADSNAAFNTAVCNSEEFRKAWITPPSWKDISDVYAISPNLILTNENNTKEIYTMYVNELKNADFDDWFNLYTLNTYSEIEFECTCIIDGKSYYMSLPVYEEITPETFKKLNEIFNNIQLDKYNSFNELINKLEKIEGSYSGYIEVSVYNDVSDLVMNLSYDFYNSVEVVKDIMDTPSGDYIKLEKEHIEINFHLYSTFDDSIEGNGYYFSFPANENTISKLKNIGNDNENVVISIY